MSGWSALEATLSPWAWPAAAAMAALLLGYVGYRVQRALLVRLTRGAPVASAVIQGMQSALRFLLPLLALQLVWQGAPTELPGLAGVTHLASVLLIAAFTATAIGAVRGVARAVIALHPQDVEDNLHARRVLTQTRVLARIVIGMLTFAGAALMLMTFPTARQVGTSLLASAGLSALVLGIAARSVFSNLLAGLQIALAQPIRIDDVLIVEGEWGRVEEITGTYVVLKIWDERRLIIPLQWFIEHPFQNWTRTTSQIIGSVFLWADYTVDVDALRAEAQRLAQGSRDHDGRVCLLQVTDANERAVQLRLIVSSPSSGQNWDLRCLLREGLIDFLRRQQPTALPRVRAWLEETAPAQAGPAHQSAVPASGGPPPPVGDPPPLHAPAP